MHPCRLVFLTFGTVAVWGHDSGLMTSWPKAPTQVGRMAEQTDAATKHPPIMLETLHAQTLSRPREGWKDHI